MFAVSVFAVRLVRACACDFLILLSLLGLSVACPNTSPSFLELNY